MGRQVPRIRDLRDISAWAHLRAVNGKVREMRSPASRCANGMVRATLVSDYCCLKYLFVIVRRRETERLEDNSSQTQCRHFVPDACSLSFLRLFRLLLSKQFFQLSFFRRLLHVYFEELGLGFGQFSFGLRERGGICGLCFHLIGRDTQCFGTC